MGRNGGAGAGGGGVIVQQNVVLSSFGCSNWRDNMTRDEMMYNDFSVIWHKKHQPSSLLDFLSSVLVGGKC